MQNNSIVSTNKIIFFVVFICAALITSLFVFRMTHQATAPTLSSDNVLIFPEPRDIKPFQLVTENNAIFTEKNFRDHWTLVFFGFTHCSNVCPTTFDMLKRAYVNLQPTYPNLQVVLVSLDPERDSADALAKYTKSFHPDFVGVTGKYAELRKLQGEFGIYSAKESTGKNYQLQHTSSIILVNPRGQWSGLFKFGMTPDEFINVFKQSMQVLSKQS
ncbi:MAG: Electron transport protein SCO1/SenC [uncultured bacterium]|nr:MAG: Electron transport protein SCO1/SenC [uncultured bacterium]